MDTNVNKGAAGQEGRPDFKSKFFEGIEPWLVVGAALYWASIIAQFLIPSTIPVDADAPFVLMLRYLLLAGFVGLCLLFPQALSTERGRTVISVLAIAAVLFTTLVPGGHVLYVSDNGIVPILLQLVPHVFTVAVLMIAWGFAFASMDKRHAGQNVAATALVTSLLVLVLLYLSVLSSAFLVSRCGMILSSLVVLSGKIRFHNCRRTRTGRAFTRCMPFFLSRIGFGMFMGFCLKAPFHLNTTDVSPVLLALGLVGGCFAAVAYSRSAEKLYIELPALLFLAIGIVYLPFFDGGIEAVSAAAVGLVWFAWAAFSAFQLSDLKERFGVRELTLCLVEKFVLSLSIVAGIGLYHAVAFAFNASASSEIMRYVIFAGTFAFVLGSSNAMAHLVSARKDDEIRDELTRTRRQHAERVYDCIAAEFGLSTREREVLDMLANGYTRTYIGSALGISDGTAKAHIAHVYQKLGVHHKDDLLDMVDRRLRGQ